MATVQRQPWKLAAETYLEYGWEILPLPKNEKANPPKHTTGVEGKPIANIQDYAEDSNIGIRLPKWLLGVDVDLYKPKGLESWQSLLSAGLPESPYISSRSDGSGIRLYRIPENLQWDGKIAGEGIDLIRWDHRYCVAPPSIHPSGEPYSWHLKNGHKTNTTVLVPADGSTLPEMPIAVVDLLTNGQQLWTPSIIPPNGDLPITLLNGSICPRVKATLERSMAELTEAFKNHSSRHDVMVSRVLALARLGVNHHGGQYAINEFRQLWVNFPWETMRTSVESPGLEFDRALHTALARIASDPIIELCRGADCAKLVSADLPVIDTSLAFWNKSEMRQEIYRVAMARNVNPWAVLNVCLVRVAVNISPRWRVPGSAGIFAMNMFAGIVGQPGSGKTVIINTAKELVPSADAIWRTPGSGEGIYSLYGRPATNEEMKDGHPSFIRTNSRGGLEVDEIGLFETLINRSGATLAPTLKTMFMGGAIGSLNANAERRRHLEAFTYRLGLVTGVLPDHAGALLNDMTGGLPQRFLLTPARSPLQTKYVRDRENSQVRNRWLSPQWNDMMENGNLPNLVDIPADVEKLIDDKQELVWETMNAAEGHLVLLHIKLAIALAWLDSRPNPTLEDWNDANILVQMSRDTLRALVEYQKEVKRNKAKAAGDLEGVASAAKAKSNDAAMIQDCVEAILRLLTKQADWLPYSTIRNGTSKRLRHLTKEALADLEERKLVERQEIVKTVGGRDRVHLTYRVRT